LITHEALAFHISADMSPYYPVLDKNDFHHFGRPSSFERGNHDVQNSSAVPFDLSHRLCGIAYTSAGGQS